MQTLVTNNEGAVTAAPRQFFPSGCLFVQFIQSGLGRLHGLLKWGDTRDVGFHSYCNGTELLRVQFLQFLFDWPELFAVPAKNNGHTLWITAKNPVDARALFQAPVHDVVCNKQGAIIVKTQLRWLAAVPVAKGTNAMLNNQQVLDTIDPDFCWLCCAIGFIVHCAFLH